MMPRRRAFLLVSLTLVFVLGLSGLTQAQAIVSLAPDPSYSVNIPPGGIVKFRISVNSSTISGFGPICQIQLGTSLATPGIIFPTGPGLRVPVSLTVDGGTLPGIKNAIRGLGPFEFVTFQVDNSGGNLTLFVADSEGVGVTAGDVAEIVFRADEQQGTALPVTHPIVFLPTNMSVTSCTTNVTYNLSLPTDVEDGSVTITPFGDVNGDFVVTGADALLALRCLGGWDLNSTQKQLADVAPPRTLTNLADIDINDPKEFFTSGDCIQAPDPPEPNPEIADVRAIALNALGIIQLPAFELPVAVPTATNRFQGLAADEHKTVLISIKRMPKPGLAGVQGSLKFDPAKMQVNSISGLNGFIVLAHHIDNDTGVVKFVAGSINKDGLYKGDILKLDTTTSSAKNPSMKLSMQSFDVNGNPIKGKPAFGLKTLKSGMGALKVHKIHLLANPVRFADEAHFTVMGQGIESVRLEVFGLSGSKLFDSGFQAGDAVAWPLHANHKPVANGVYLAVISVRGRGGELVRDEVRKIIVLR